MTDDNPGSLLTDATVALEARCRQLLSAAEESTERLAKLFTDDEIVITCAACLAFMEALAHTAPEEFAKSREAFVRLRDVTMRVNLMVAGAVRFNPRLMAFAVSAEETLFSMLLAGDATVAVLSEVGMRFRLQVETFLSVVFTGLRLELERPDRMEGGQGRLLAKLKSNLASLQRSQKSILWYVSGKASEFKPKDRREISAIRQTMVEFAGLLLDRNPGMSHRTAAVNVIRKFENVPGAYEDADSFRRQIDRARTSG